MEVVKTPRPHGFHHFWLISAPPALISPPLMWQQKLENSLARQPHENSRIRFEYLPSWGLSFRDIFTFISCSLSTVSTFLSHPARLGGILEKHPCVQLKQIEKRDCFEIHGASQVPTVPFGFPSLFNSFPLSLLRCLIQHHHHFAPAQESCSLLPCYLLKRLHFSPSKFE